MKIPKKVVDRLQATLKTFQAVAESHKKRDVSEADTVTLVKDILADSFGFDKYNELTSEQQIRGTYCDLAVKIDGKIKYLIEVKAAGIDLNDSHLRQAQNYGANEGIEWIVLTNAVEWKLYRIKFGQPIDVEDITAFNILNINVKNEDDLTKLFLLCREGLTSDAMDEFHQLAQLVNKYVIGQILQTEPILSAVRKEMRRLFPELKIDNERIGEIITHDVLKREVLEGEKFKDAQQRIRKATQKLAHAERRKVATKELSNAGSADINEDDVVEVTTSSILEDDSRAIPEV